MDDKAFTKELTKHIKILEKELPSDEAKLSQMQQEVEKFADTVRSKVRILADIKKLHEKYSGPEAVTSTPWQEAVVTLLMKGDEIALKDIYASVKRFKNTDYDTVMQYVLGLMKKNRVVRVSRGVYRWQKGMELAAPARTVKPKKRKAAKKAGKKPRRKKVSWIQVAERIMRKDPEKIWTNITLCVEVENRTKEIVTNKRMGNFIRRAHVSGLIKRESRGEYSWASK